MSADLLKEYDAREKLFSDYTTCLEGLLGTLLQESGIKPHSISSRLKSRCSLGKKITRPDKRYESLDQVTDICGVRIITYFKEEVDLVAQLIEASLLVDKEKTIDKRGYEIPDRFGYQSLHTIISLDQGRCKLGEYRKFAGIKAEIQIRTVIQHAWAEIEHDLGYKSELAVPIPIKRRLHRLAAILELSDEEFSQIKETLSIYERSLSSAIKLTPQNISLDKSSMLAFLRSNERLVRVETRVAEEGGCVREDAEEKFVDRFTEYFHWLGIKTIDALEKALAENEETVFRLMMSRAPAFKNKRFSKGLGMLYLCYAIMAANKDEKCMVGFLTHFQFGSSSLSNTEFAKSLIAVASTKR